MVDEPHGQDGEVDESLAAGGDDPGADMGGAPDAPGEDDDTDQERGGLRDRLSRMSLDRMVIIAVGAIAVGYIGYKWVSVHELHKNAPVSSPSRPASRGMSAGSPAGGGHPAPSGAGHATPRVINPVHIQTTPRPHRHHASAGGAMHAPGPASPPPAVPASAEKGSAPARLPGRPPQARSSYPAAPPSTVAAQGAAAASAPGGSKYLGKAVYLAIHDLTSEMKVMRKQSHSLTTTNRQLTHSVKQLAHKLLAVEKQEATAQLALASTESSLLVHMHDTGRQHGNSAHHARHHAHSHHVHHVVHRHHVHVRRHRPHMHVDAVSKGRAVISVNGHVHVIHDGSHVHGLGVVESIAPNGHIAWRR